MTGRGSAPTLDSWDELARGIGYNNERDMFEKLYTLEGMSISDLAERLGFSSYTIQRHLSALQIPKRRPGGANRTPVQARKLFWLDQRVVLHHNLDELAELVQVSRSLLYKYRRTSMGGSISAIKLGKLEFDPESPLDASQAGLDRISQLMREAKP